MTAEFRVKPKKGQTVTINKSKFKILGVFKRDGIWVVDMERVAGRD